MRYTGTVNSRVQTDNRRQLHYLFGSILCGLLLFFAVSAKLALYQPQQQSAKSIAATKVWKSNAIPAPDSEPVQVSLLNLFAVVLSMSLVTISLLSHCEPVLPAPNWFTPDLSVRPPPTR